MSYLDHREIRDGELTVQTSLPVAGANVIGAALDLEQQNLGALENVVVEIAFPALPNLVSGKAVTATLYGGSNPGALSKLDPVVSTSVVGAASGGGAEKKVVFRLPVKAPRYIAAHFAVDASGGDNTGAKAAVSLLF